MTDTLHIAFRTHAERGRHLPKTVKRSETKRDIQERQRAWLREVLETKRLKPSQLAIGAGVSDTTISRLLNSETYTGTLAQETIERIKDTYKVPGPEEYAGGRGRATALLGLSEASRFDPRKEKADLARVIEAIMHGRANVEPWRLKTMALDSVGYLPGDIVIVEALPEGRLPKPQDAVCAQVVDYQHGAAETVWRVYDPPFLVGASTERTAFKPLLVDGDRVKIAGVIREVYRPHSLSATR